jgi:hypothetical protein
MTTVMKSRRSSGRNTDRCLPTAGEALHMVNDAARRYNQKAHDITESFSAKVVPTIFKNQDQVLPDSLLFVSAEVDSLWRKGLGAASLLP